MLTKTAMSTDKIHTILDYWFHGIDDQSPMDRNQLPFKKWFLKDERVDEEIRELFESDLIKAAEGAYKKWEDDSQGRLALILLYDQFSRNMYRDTVKMYAYDALALELTLGSISQERDRELMLIQRAFLYLPLMHFEDLSLQQMSVDCFTKLVEESKIKIPDNTHYYEYTLKYAQEHFDTITKFGRFPYRDSILGRNSKELKEF